MEGGGKGESKKVMVVIDESDSSYHALMWVLNNLKESITSSVLVLFAALPPPSCSFGFGAPFGLARLYFQGLAAPEVFSMEQERSKKICLGILKKAEGICASRGVKVETLTDAGDPRVTICNAVNKNNINLLILGHESHGILKRVFLGTLSDHQLNNVKCPILVVKRLE
ncbi:Usp domain-containing protein [Psidium guajava]|nr:Usp domain-containing protein [Psidium guajava]